MKLSQIVWQQSSKVIESIKTHPFNQELARGVLSVDIFSYYIEQDILYLQDFARCLAMIASKAPSEYIRSFLRYSDGVFIVEQEVSHNFFKKTFNFKETGLITSATFNYTSYLLSVCALSPVEVAISAVLPCFWVYREVGLHIAKHTSRENKFLRWIETYAGEDFGKEVAEAISIFDDVAAKSNDSIRTQMRDAFYKSTCLEWHFWNDAYNKEVFDKI